MLPNAKISEQAAVLATINPVSQGVGTAVSGWISAANFERFQAMLSIGAFGAAATVDAKLQQATDAVGTGAKDIAGKAVVQLLAAGGNNRQALINLRASELDVNNGFSYFQLSVTVAAAATLIAANVLGGVAKNLPASALNQAGVAQIIG
jgi:hypothetical protein